MRHPGRLFTIVVTLALGGVAIPVRQARADRVTLDRPVAISTVRADKKPLDGRVVAYDDDGFVLVQGKNKAVTVRWDELGPPGLFNVRSSLLGQKATGEEWLELGRTMLGVDGGAPFADRAFSRALKLNPKLKGDVDEAKRSQQSKPATKDKQPRGAKSDDTPAPKDAADPGGGGAAAARPGAGTMGGPQVVGVTDGSNWGKLTDEQQAKQVTALKAFAESAGKRLNKKLTLNETKYFLFYSDLSPKEAAKWAGLLDRMYARLAELFAVPKEDPGAGRDAGIRDPGGERGRGSPGAGAGGGGYANVWYGKALVLVFQKDDDYRQFQIRVHQTDAGGSAGMCHCYGDGKVHIAFYRQPDELTFAHVLVHESVHGFVHRFRAPPTVPSWANEGLAEVIAEELVPRPGRAKERVSRARESLQHYGGLSGMLDARHIAPWQYPVAEALCEFMIRQDKRRYVDFIAGIKEGLTWEQSLQQRYKAPRERLVRAFGESLGIKGLKE